MKRMCIYGMFLSISSLVYCAAGSSTASAAESPAMSYIVPDFLRVIYGQDHPDVCVQCFERRTKEGRFFSGDEALICAVVGHPDQRRREEICAAVGRKLALEGDDFWATDNAEQDSSSAFVSELMQSDKKTRSVQELIERAPLKLIMVFMSCSRRSLSTTTWVQAHDVKGSLDKYCVDAIMRYPAFPWSDRRFQEITRRVERRLCAKEVLSLAYAHWIKQNNEIGIEIDTAKQEAYFEQRIAESKKAAL